MADVLSTSNVLTEFSWQPQPDAAAEFHEIIGSFRSQFDPVGQLAARMLHETGTRLVDWIDHVQIPHTDDVAERLQSAGFELSEDASGMTFRHRGAIFAPIRMEADSARRLAIRVDSVVDFLAAYGVGSHATINGSPYAEIRQAVVAGDSEHQLLVVERHGNRLDCTSPERFPDASPGGAIAPRTHASPPNLELLARHHEAFRLRQREFEDDAEGFAQAHSLIQAATNEIGTSRACELFFMAEREYWQRRNRAARVQKARQDALGLGWANHDHHTYRSSRTHFWRLIGVLEQLGFACRERFYAGREAGWGAQVLEHPDTGIIIFADVDLSPHEVMGDFAHEPLPPRNELGTVGLWCRLHGEAFLQAGMHHLECQFDFNAARDQLQLAGVKLMKPFTDLPWLRQAFTEGEVWRIKPQRIESLLREDLITVEQAEQFRKAGAIGSHLEVLQRDDGYKGFNQTGINEIIRDTDPRRLTAQLSGA